MGLTARDVMQREVRVVHPKTRLVELQDLFLARRVNGFPVVDGERLVGIVSRSDVVRRLALERSLAGYIADLYRDTGPFALEEPPDEHESVERISEEVGARLAELTVADVMVESVVTVAPEAPIDAVARVLLERHIHRVPVVEKERLVGIVTALDLARLIAEGRLRSAG
jgi:CBS domain-containing protein